MKSLKGWRTIILNTIATIVPILSLTEVAAIVPPEYMPHYTLIVVLLNMALRGKTTTPIFRAN